MTKTGHNLATGSDISITINRRYIEFESND